MWRRFDVVALGLVFPATRTGFEVFRLRLISRDLVRKVGRVDDLRQADAGDVLCRSGG